MADSIVAVDTVTLIGGPAKVNVALDFGPQGQRGSLILYGLGKPGDLPTEDFSFAPQLLDWYINLDTTDNEYLFIYQYVNKDGLDQWDRIFKIIPNVYNTNETIEFVDGVATVNIAVSNTTLALLPGIDFTQLKLNTHIDIEVPADTPLEETYPAITTFRIGTPTINNNEYYLPIYLGAIELVPTGVPAAPYLPTPVTGTRTAHISINVI